jgi:NAD(P)-dependent dehydrogenase (short-subunit alcohol dehydrogenase family)
MSRTALITGAAGGLGSALAHRLADEGWNLALVSRQAARLEDLVSLPGGFAIEADVSTPDGASRAFEAATDHFGQVPDALANCAGSTLISPLHRTTAEQYRDCMRANVDSAFHTLSAFVRACTQARQPGSAVLVGSVVAHLGVINHEAIAAAKAGVEALARSAAATYGAQAIRVNAIVPGLLRTPATERLFSAPQAEKQIAAQYPLKRYGTAQDGAAAIAWLLSDEAGWITGQCLPVDGGFTAVRPMVRA